MMATAIQRLGLGFLLLSCLLCCAESAKVNAKNGQSLMTWLRSMRTKRQDNSLTSDRVWTLSDAIPGKPDLDYPILSEIPDTDFSCDGRKEGYYADIEARCQVFRICANTANDTKKGFAFLCPNGTLFNQEYFVCDWYMNVKCENSENFYKLNELIGNTMTDSTKREMMNSAREIIMFPQKTPNGIGNVNMFTDYPSQLASPLGINGGSGSGLPSRGNLNLAQPTGGAVNFPGPGRVPSRAGIEETVYVNSLGQLSTDKDSGFDPNHSYILKPDRDSAALINPLKGTDNSYSFGFPGGNEAPTRGSEDLSEPVDPSAYYKEQYLPPFANGNQKQIYTYPLDPQSQGFNNIPGPISQYASPFNSRDTYPASQIYGSGLPQEPASQNRYQPQTGANARPQPASQNRYQQSNNQSPPRPQQNQQQQQSVQPQKLYQQPHQTLGAQNKFQNSNNNQYQQSQPARFNQQPQNQRQQQSFSQQPQPFRPQNQQQQADRRQFNVPQNNNNGYQNQNQNRNGNGNRNGNRNGHQNQQQHQNHKGHGSNGHQQSNGNQQSNGDYLRNFLKDKTHIHHDKGQLVELIQRLFVPSSTQQRVVSADVVPSPARESYSFTYDDEGAASNSNSNYKPAYSGHHQHTGTCGHQRY